MRNQEIADIFGSMADLMEILGQDPFRVNSYRKAARVLEELAEAVEEVAAAGKLTDIPGIGKSTAAKIEQFLQTGKVEQHEALKAQVPAKLPDLLAIPGLGPKTAAKLWKEADITSVEALREALQNHPERVTGIGGLGEKKAHQLLESLAFADSAAGRIRLGEADDLAAALIESLRARKGVKRVVAAGSLRRGKETIGDIDLLCEASAAAAPRIIEAFATAPLVGRVLAKGDTKGSVVLKGQVAAQADLRVVPRKSFGAALAYFTGSKAHNVRVREIAVKAGMKLNEYGLFRGAKQVAGADEEGIYAALGMSWVPAELREDRGEVEAALEGKLPELLELSDIRGDLHMHTAASDGANSIEQMIEACRQRGYRYMCIADHSKSQIQARGLDEKRLAEHVRAIRKAAAKYDDIMVLAGCEVDIFKDGRLDFEADVLAELDLVTASCHSALSQGRSEATARIVKAIEHPHVHCIGHPSGRLINSRPGMELDIERIARAAADNGVALEINAHHYRLDLRDTHVRAAVEQGAKIIISTDAHSLSDLDMMRYGVITARRGWATAKDVVNAWDAAGLKAFLKRK